MKTHSAEINQARDVFSDAIHQIGIEGRSIHAFSAAALVAAAEVYAEVHGTDELHKAFAAIVRAEQIQSGRAGRA